MNPAQIAYMRAWLIETLIALELGLIAGLMLGLIINFTPIVKIRGNYIPFNISNLIVTTI